MRSAAVPDRRSPASPPHRLRFGLRALAAVLPHPSLWRTGLHQALVLAGPRWWRRPPFLPLPDRDYLRFRLETAYGGAGDQQPRPADLLTYLRWCRDFPG